MDFVQGQNKIQLPFHFKPINQSRRCFLKQFLHSDSVSCMPATYILHLCIGQQFAGRIPSSRLLELE